MNVLSLFDGMSCGMIAMLNAGVKVDRYVAYEIDKYAVQTSSHNFPNIEHKGDVFKADFTEYEGFDFLVGGSPCTYWSIAQSPDKRETTASGLGWELFSQYVRALHEAKPKYFIYENNKSMSDDIRLSITQTFGFEAEEINSALVSAQNRQRLYWVGIRQADGTYRPIDVPQPKDKGLLVKDILDGESVSTAQGGGSFAVCANWLPAQNPDHTLEKHIGNMVAEPQQVGSMPRPNGELSKIQGFRIYDEKGKNVTINANAGGAGGKTGLYAVQDCCTFQHPHGYNEGRMVYDKFPTLTTHGVTQQQNNLVCQEKPKGEAKAFINKVYEVREGQITIKGKQYPIKLKDGFYTIRKLSVTECMRLQTVPEWYEFPVSDSQAYKMLGNGWTCDVITHLIECCLKGVTAHQQLTLF